MSLTDGARRLRADVATLARALRDPHAPRAPKLVALAAIIYVASPVDLVPDWTARTGLVDDLAVALAAAVAAWRLLPSELIADHRARVEAGAELPRGRARPLAGALMWVTALTLLAWWAWGFLAPA